MENINTKRYWNQRLMLNYNLAGVGFHAIGESYNRWLYKIRETVFNIVLQQLSLDVTTAKIMEVGSGTGFYLELLKKRNAENVTGMDFTPTVINRLSAKYNDIVFWLADISENDPRFAESCYDLLLVIDVLFHIVEDHKYKQAIKNIVSMTKPGGYIILSENLSPFPADRGHIKDRTRAEIIPILTDNHLEIVRFSPMFILMNPPASSDNALLKNFSKVRIKMLKWATRHKLSFVGHLAGAILFPVELLLLRFWPANKQGPCTNFIICRKK